ncbi:MAG: secondary thiamine-phosphate synthase enzyme YjbQ [Pseudomonadota bacterium]
MWWQKNIILKPRSRGFHLVTGELVSQLPKLGSVRIGLAHFFLQHTSAALSINENADPSVRTDFEAYFSRTVRENEPYYTHTLEGPDDMPAHIKTSLLGTSLSVPVSDGKLSLGTWQGIYLCEFRNHASGRSVVITVNGE